MKIDRMPRQTQPAAEQQHHLAQAVNACIRALPHIRDLLPEPDSGGPRTGTIHRSQAEAREPWQGAAAAVYWTIHFGARRLETDLRVAIGLNPRSPARGGSEANTIDALLALNNLTPTADPKLIAATARRVEAWVSAVDRLEDMDRAEDWRPLPRTPGQLIVCPFCNTLSLRVNLRREVVRCFNPACRDSEGNPPVARMERGIMSGLNQLVFRDGREVDYREVAEIPPEE